MNPTDSTIIIFPDLEGATVLKIDCDTFYEAEEIVSLAFEKGIKKVLKKDDITIQVTFYPPHLLGKAFVK